MYSYSSKTTILRIAILLAVGTGGLVTAQTNNARLEGTIQDSSGSILPVAKVSISNDQTHTRLDQVTSMEGHYIFPALQPGQYTLTVEAPGFRRFVVNGIVLTVSQNLSQNVTLELGAVTETIDVRADAVSVQTNEAQTSQVVTMKDIDTLPQLSRAVASSLAILMPGVQINPGGGGRVNGMRNGSNNTTLDGMYVSDPTAPSLGQALTGANTDSVGEFRMVTSGSNAEYGYNAGANIQMITRSGGNRWSGTLFEYMRNTVLNANSFFSNSTGTARPKLIQNVYGGSLGGPIVHDKTFFFFNFQGRRTNQDSTSNRTVLTSSARQGIFQWLTPGSGAVQSYNIPLNDPRHLGIDPTIAKNIALLPSQNNTDIGDGLNTAGFRFNYPTRSLEDQFTFKADHNLTANHHVFMRYNLQNTNSLSAPSFPGQIQGASQAFRWSYVIGSDWNLRPTMVNEWRFIDRVGFTDTIRDARIAGPMFNATSSLWTNPLDPSFPSGRGSPQKEVTDNLTIVHGSHTFKTGFNVRFFQLRSYTSQGIYPDVTFNVANGATVPTTIGPTGSAVISSASRTIFENLYNNLLGRIDQTTLTFYSDLTKYLPAGQARSRNHLTKESGYFFQDDWRITRNLTLNLGLRYDLFGAPSEQNGFIGAYDKADLLSRTGKLSDLSVTPGAPWFKTDKNNFAPRFGFAWDPRGKGKMAVRGHFGVFYDRTVSGAEVDIDTAMPGFSNINPLFPNGAGNSDVRIADGLVIPSQPASIILQQPATRLQTITVLNPNLRTGYVLDYGLSIQHEIARNTIMEVGFVGNRGIKLFLDEDINQLRITEDFLQAFKEIQAFQSAGTAPPATNSLVRLFGTPAAVISKLGATNFSQGLVGTVANNVDRQNFSTYTAAGLSPFYLRNYPQFNQVIYGTNDGRSYYNSLQVSVQRQVGTMRLSANYTFSKTVDLGSSDGTGFSSPIDNFNLLLNRGRGDGDRPHVFNATVSYTLPIGRGKALGKEMPGWADRLVGGWELGSIVIWESGGAFTVSSNRATGAIPGNTWANYSGSRNIGSVDRRGDGVYYFAASEIAGFSFPGAGEIGNSGRNSFRGPGYINDDFSLVKKFKITERQSVNFRWECYNLFNHPTFGGLTTNLTTPATFGKFSSLVGDPRIMQASLRYTF